MYEMPFILTAIVAVATQMHLIEKLTGRLLFPPVDKSAYRTSYTILDVVLVYHHTSVWLSYITSWFLQDNVSN